MSTLDDVTYHSEVAATDRDLTIAADTIDGDMTVDSEIAPATSHGAGQAVSLAVATFIAQCCSDSVQVRRGPDQQLKLAPHAGGYFAPSKCPSP